MDLSDDDINRDEFPNGIKVTFACNIGYERVAGSRAITCTNGAWSELSLQCDSKY